MDDLIKRADHLVQHISQLRRETTDTEDESANIITALVERVRELEAALEQIIYEADEYDDSPANELVSIARKALGRG